MSSKINTSNVTIGIESMSQSFGIDSNGLNKKKNPICMSNVTPVRSRAVECQFICFLNPTSIEIRIKTVAEDHITIIFPKSMIWYKLNRLYRSNGADSEDMTGRKTASSQVALPV